MSPTPTVPTGTARKVRTLTGALQIEIEVVETRLDYSPNDADNLIEREVYRWVTPTPELLARTDQTISFASAPVIDSRPRHWLPRIAAAVGTGLALSLPGVLAFLLLTPADAEQLLKVHAITGVAAALMFLPFWPWFWRARA